MWLRHVVIVRIIIIITVSADIDKRGDSWRSLECLLVVVAVRAVIHGRAGSNLAKILARAAGFRIPPSSSSSRELVQPRSLGGLP